MGEAIYKIKGIELEKLKKTSPLDRWFYKMVQKSVKELTIGDISRMLRQEVYLDIAIPCAKRMVLDDPLCGEMYDGEILELLIRVFANNPKEKSEDFYTVFLSKVQQKFKTCEWESSAEKEYYEKLLNAAISEAHLSVCHHGYSQS